MTVAYTYEELKDKPDQQYGVKKLILAEWYQFCSYKKCLSKWHLENWKAVDFVFKWISAEFSKTR